MWDVSLPRSWLKALRNKRIIIMQKKSQAAKHAKTTCSRLDVSASQLSLSIFRLSNLGAQRLSQLQLAVIELFAAKQWVTFIDILIVSTDLHRPNVIIRSLLPRAPQNVSAFFRDGLQDDALEKQWRRFLTNLFEASLRRLQISIGIQCRAGFWPLPFYNSFIGCRQRRSLHSPACQAKATPPWPWSQRSFVTSTTTWLPTCGIAENRYTIALELRMYVELIATSPRATPSCRCTRTSIPAYSKPQQ